MKCTFHFIHRWMSDYDIAHSLHSFLQHFETKSVRLKIWYAISHKNSFKMFLHLNAAYLTCMKWIKLLILMFNYFHHVYQHLLQSLPISLLQTKRIRTYMKNDPRWRIADRGPRSRTACSENRVGVQRTCSARRSRSSPSVSWAESRARARFTRRKRKGIVFRGMMQEVSVSFMCACAWLPRGGWCITAEST